MRDEGRLVSHSLRWVRSELDVVADQAKSALVRFVDDSSDVNHLEQAKSAFYKLANTLQMVELRGAAMLAQEMEMLTDALVKGEIQNQSGTLEAILHSTLYFPQYLDYIESGHYDSPLALLPMLNDLRGARNASPLSEKALFSQEVKITLSDSKLNPDSKLNKAWQNQDDIRSFIRQLRYVFQSSLLGWFRGHDEDTNLCRLYAVSQKLFFIAKYEGSRRLWRVSSALIEALLCKALMPNTSIKTLLGEVDRQLKVWIKIDEAKLVSAIPDQLLKDLLFYVGSANGVTKLVNEVKRTYGLDLLLPQVGVSNQVLSTELLNTVYSAVKEDITQLKDKIEALFYSKDDNNNENILTVMTKLSVVSGTYRMLDIDNGYSLINEAASKLADVINQQIPLGEALLLNIASCVMKAEHILDELFEKSRHDRANILNDNKVGSESALSYPRSNLHNIIAKEVLTDIIQVKEAISTFIIFPQNREALKQIATYLEKAHGALVMMDADYILPIINAARCYINERLLTEENLDIDELETFADVITSIECYMDSDSDIHHVLDVGYKSIARLGYGARKDELSSSLFKDIDTSNADVAKLEINRLDTTPDLISTTDTTQPRLNELLEDSRLRFQKICKQRNIEILTGAVDEDILEIFLEEAKEEIDKISSLMPAYQDDPNNTNALMDIRRSFHTLKGGGRMVGAQLIGEYAWAFENLLNRIVDNTLSPSQELHLLLEEGIKILPALMSVTRGEIDSVHQVFSLMDQADILSGKQVKKI